MEYVDGKNALEWTKALKGPLPINAAAQIGRHLLSALDYAHSKGYVHRDVKPSNLLVLGPVHRPRVKLSDFGLAKSFDETEGFTTLTRQGDVGGSIGFISPDHIRDFREVREPADIYSAAATLFYLLTNRYPYLGFDPRQPGSYEIILQNPPVPLRAFRPDAPERLERILLKALAEAAARPMEIRPGDGRCAPAVRPAVLVLSQESIQSTEFARLGTVSPRLRGLVDVKILIGIPCPDVDIRVTVEPSSLVTHTGEFPERLMAAGA